MTWRELRGLPKKTGPEDRLDTLVAYGHSVGTERRHECRRGTHSCAMPLSFPNSAHLHKWWGGRPRPHPAPWPACRWWQAPDSSREERAAAACGGGPPRPRAPPRPGARFAVGGGPVLMEKRGGTGPPAADRGVRPP